MKYVEYVEEKIQSDRKWQYCRLIGHLFSTFPSFLTLTIFVQLLCSHEVRHACEKYLAIVVILMRGKRETNKFAAWMIDSIDTVQRNL